MPASGGTRILSTSSQEVKRIRWRTSRFLSLGPPRIERRTERGLRSERRLGGGRVGTGFRYFVRIRRLARSGEPERTEASDRVASRYGHAREGFGKSDPDSTGARKIGRSRGSVKGFREEKAPAPSGAEASPPPESPPPQRPVVRLLDVKVGAEAGRRNPSKEGFEAQIPPFSLFPRGKAADAPRRAAGKRTIRPSTHQPPARIRAAESA